MPNGVPLQVCGWRLGTRSSEKCQAMIPHDEAAVRLHFQMVHRDVHIWSEEKEACIWGTNACKWRPLGKNIVGHGVKLHLGPNAKYPV